MDIVNTDIRFVALGDSFTEGVGDERPDGTPRGWADRVAEGLADRAGAAGLRYANLAIRGRLLPEIAGSQVTAALALRPAPTLLSLNGGGNDMLRPGMDVDRLAELTGRALDACQAAGVHVLLLAGADPSAGLPFGRLIRRRGALLTERIAPLADRDGVTFVDAFNDAELRHARYWSPDRLHLNPAGHARVAARVLAALRREDPDLTAGDGDPARPHRSDPNAAVRRLATEVGYYRRHVGPWVGRRLTGRSSGDGRTAKHPTWQTLSAADSHAGSPIPSPGPAPGSG